MGAQELFESSLQGKTIFFAGKGGVGKTTVSCATAVWLAGRGHKVLLVTTDPAAHLSQVFLEEVGSEVGELKQVKGLFAARIDQKKEAQEYAKEVVDEAMRKYSDDVVRVMKEQLDSPCTEELAAFNRFVDYVQIRGYDNIVFDTAPTGHTLRLLMLPVNWTRQLEVSALATAQGSIASGETREKYERVIDTMRDTGKTIFSFVTYPEYTPIMEAYRASEEMASVGVKTSLIVANYVLPNERCTNEYFKKRRLMQERYLQMLKEKFDVPIIKMPMLDEEAIGVDKLRKVGRLMYGGQND
jgi:arsenite-transporting ATPase